MRYLILDSTFVIDHLRGESGARRAVATVMFEEGDEPVVTEIVVCEVRTGSHDRDGAIARALPDARPNSSSRAVRPRRLAGTWRADVKDRGRTLGCARRH